MTAAPEPERLEAHEAQVPQHVHESRWPASLAVVASIVLYVTLPEKLTFGPVWLVPALEASLLVPLTVTAPHRHIGESTLQRVMSMSLIGILNLANIISLLLLVDSLLEGAKTTGVQLILSAMQIWLTNVLIFALWYWEFDRSGPGNRLSARQGYPDFLFPQMTASSVAPPGWAPRFVDYLYLSFTNSTAFSPTDTLPLTSWAKMLMLVQSLTSLVALAVVAARAVNTLS